MSVVDGVTSALVNKVLDLSLVRHSVLASNVANVHSVGFFPLKVSFEDQLAGLGRLARGVSDRSVLRGQVEALEARVVVSGESEVKLDEQVALLTQNALRYQALIVAKGKLGDIMSMAVKGGGR